MSLSDKITKILHYFRRPDKSAKMAKDRLQIIIAHERTLEDKPDYLPLLQKDILAVVAKYVTINQDDVRIELERKDSCSILELNVVLPHVDS